MLPTKPRKEENEKTNRFRAAKKLVAMGCEDDKDILALTHVTSKELDEAIDERKVEVFPMW